jgi:hypothetical protein
MRAEERWHLRPLRLPRATCFGDEAMRNGPAQWQAKLRAQVAAGAHGQRSSASASMGCWLSEMRASAGLARQELAVALSLIVG